MKSPEEIYLMMALRRSCCQAAYDVFGQAKSWAVTIYMRMNANSAKFRKINFQEPNLPRTGDVFCFSYLFHLNFLYFRGNGFYEAYLASPVPC
jgi:hypothetical protein